MTRSNHSPSLSRDRRSGVTSTAEVILGLSNPQDRSRRPKRPARTPPSTFLFLLFNLSNSTRPEDLKRPKPQNVYTRRLKTRPGQSQTRSNPPARKQNRQPIRRSRDRLSQHQSREERRRRRHRVSPRPVVVGRFIGATPVPVNTRKSSDESSTRAVDSEGEKDPQPHTPPRMRRPQDPVGKQANRPKAERIFSWQRSLSCSLQSAQRHHFEPHAVDFRKKCVAVVWERNQPSTGPVRNQNGAARSRFPCPNRPAAPAAWCQSAHWAPNAVRSSRSGDPCSNQPSDL